MWIVNKLGGVFPLPAKTERMHIWANKLCFREVLIASEMLNISHTWKLGDSFNILPKIKKNLKASSSHGPKLNLSSFDAIKELNKWSNQILSGRELNTEHMYLTNYISPSWPMCTSHWTFNCQKFWRISRPFFDNCTFSWI